MSCTHDCGCTLGLGVQITGPAALAEVARLTAELAEVKRTYTPCDLDLLTERDALAAQVARVESLAEEWLATDEANADYFSRERLEPTLVARVATIRQEQLQAALAGSEADTTDVDVCSGDADCTSALHVHGCFADEAGPCTNPDEHQSADQEVK